MAYLSSQKIILKKSSNENKFESPTQPNPRDPNAEKEKRKFGVLDRSIDWIQILVLWAVFGFFIFLLFFFWWGVFRIYLELSIHKDAFVVLASFLAGSLGAGFSDKIFGVLRKRWRKE